jgi:hypothetical protein
VWINIDTASPLRKLDKVPTAPVGESLYVCPNPRKFSFVTSETLIWLPDGHKQQKALG